eukprot:gene31227-40592_t
MGAIYKWEQNLQRSWEVVTEDKEGNIHVEREKASNRGSSKDSIQREDHDRDRLSCIRRGLIRYMIVALDCSAAAGQMDVSYRPNRLETVKNSIQKFIIDFFDQNPISSLGVIVTRNGLAESLSELCGNSKNHINRLKNLQNTAGTASLQNTLTLSISLLKHIPQYGHRQLLVVFSSLSTCDPGDIFSSIREAQAHRVQISVICLVAEVFICKQLAELTGGTFAVATDSMHLAQLLQGHTVPPPQLATDMESAADETGNTVQAGGLPTSKMFTDFIYMGFPKRVFDTKSNSSFSFDGKRICLSSTSYICPRCHVRSTDIPTQCCVCTLQLNSSSHIARSHHHLFPVPEFEEYALQHHEDSSSIFVPLSVSASSDRYMAPPSIAPAASEKSVDDKGKEKLELSHVSKLTLSGGEMHCAGCLVGFLQMGGVFERKIDGVEYLSIFRCPRCSSLFCSVCDAFIHESLHNCPCCSSEP